MNAIAVSQLNNYIKQVFEAEEMLHNIEVIGEIDGLNVRGNGVFFTLKDKDAVISCSCFNAATIQKMRQNKNGTQVIVRGSVTYWNKVGKINFTVYSCEAFGLGQLFLKFEELKKRLEAEGLFSAKKQLPTEVKRIGVVTSRAGAVLHDIIKVAHRRNPNVDIVLYPVIVQGDGADRQVCDGIKYFSDGNSIVDVIIVARGGGSKEDLAAFNSECIVITISQSKIPVVSAVGHETDWTLIDLAVDVRAATPSAAAEIVVREIVSERENIVRAYRHLTFALKSKVEQMFGRLERRWTDIKSLMTLRMQEHEGKIQALSGIIEANNPLAVLRRGYAKIYKDKKQVVSIEDAEVGDKLDIKMYNGTIGVQVWMKK